MEGPGQHTIGDQLRALLKDLFFGQLVGFLAVAAHMGKLQITDIRGVTASGDRDNVIHAGGKRMRPFHTEIYGVAADAAVGLGCVDLLFVGFKLRTPGAVVVGALIRTEAACRSGSGLWHGTLLSGHEKSTLFRVLVLDWGMKKPPDESSG